MTNPVFLALERSLESPTFDQLPALGAGDLVVLNASEAHHALSAKRLRAGETVDLVNGRGLRLRGQVVAASQIGGENPEGAKRKRGEDKSRLVVRVSETKQEAVAVPQFTLVQALAKHGRDEQAVESATEIGVAEVIPWQSERCVVQWRTGANSKAEKGQNKWQSLVESAVKQSRAAFIPHVAPVVDTAALATLVRERTLQGWAVFLLHEAASELLTDQLAHLRQQAVLHVMIIVGPEGGVTDAETQELRNSGAKVLRLGPSVLRSSTAGPAALAVLSALLGKWDQPVQTVVAAPKTGE